ncbi:alpha/beta hydrolase fold [Lentzea jiangxiensis]|uniref:Alpha/beta hydrolase fold n=1 Tax=Lentzea jiangxiensis TaxID=641025 RepID=A0A1H0LGV8_9PSEU|nr:alpha/beta hydrolase fold [Lentzea jiangxiensis]
MLSVEYRRAPEHPFPTPLEDACTALRWLHEHAAELGIDPTRIGVTGDSAGGGMAAAPAILTRDRGGPAIARQVIVMPMLDDRTTEVDSHVAPYALWSYDDNLTAWPGGPSPTASACSGRSSARQDRSNSGISSPISLMLVITSSAPIGPICCRHINRSMPRSA